MTRIIVSMSMEKDVWVQFKAFAKSAHLPASRMAEMVLKAAYRGKEQTVEQVMQGVLIDMIEGNTAMSKSDKEQALKSLTEK